MTRAGTALVGKGRLIHSCFASVSSIGLAGTLMAPHDGGEVLNKTKFKSIK